MALSKTSILKRAHEKVLATLFFQDSSLRSVPGMALVDDSGDQAGTTGNPLVVSGAVPAGGATEAKQDEMLVALGSYSEHDTPALTNDDGTTEQTIATGVADGWFELVGVHFIRSGGSGANYQIRVSGTSGWTLGDNTERFDSGSIPVGTELHWVATGRGTAVKADASGDIYWESGFDAGADNDATFAFILLRVRGS